MEVYSWETPKNPYKWRFIAGNIIYKWAILCKIPPGPKMSRPHRGTGSQPGRFLIATPASSRWEKPMGYLDTLGSGVFQLGKPNHNDSSCRSVA